MSSTLDSFTVVCVFLSCFVQEPHPLVEGLSLSLGQKGDHCLFEFQYSFPHPITQHSCPLRSGALLVLVYCVSTRDLFSTISGISVKI